MDRAIKNLFDRYERLTNAALAGEPDMAALGDLYDEAFVGPSPQGVIGGRKDEEFSTGLAQGFTRNREIGARRMEVKGLRMDVIDGMHALASVDWRATYDTGGTQTSIDFTNAYFIRIKNGQAKVFGWVTGDEMGQLRKYGII